MLLNYVANLLNESSMSLAGIISFPIHGDGCSNAHATTRSSGSRVRCPLKYFSLLEPSSPNRR
jgi:hypothetical protein